MSSGGAALQPTFTGHVSSTTDALTLFEACLQGHLSHVPRRPHDRERSSLIRSGSVFIYEENASGIKRWTDGVTWSPSRILGNFLVYRELDKPFPPGEKKKALKKPNRRSSRPGEPYARPERQGADYSPSSPNGSFNDRTPSDVERQLIGSLIDSYGFKQDGLVKKTMSVTVQGVTHHLVSYYSVQDVMNGNLRTPTQTESLTWIRPRQELTSKQSFRSPLEETEEMSQMAQGHDYRYSQPYPGQYDHRQPYYPGQPYPGMMPPQPGVGPGYPQQGMPPMPGHYMGGGMPAPQVSQDRSQYPPYDQSSYPRTMPPTPTSTVATSLPDRNTAAAQSMYPPNNMSRPITALSPVNMGGMNNYPAYRGMPPTTSAPDGHRQTQASPIAIKHEEQRRDYPQPPTPTYSNNQHQYYQQPPHMNQPWPANGQQ